MGLSVRPLARDLSLLLCGAVGAYLSSTWLAAKVAVPLASALQGSSSPLLRVVAGAAALDLTKAPAVLLAGLLLATAVRVRPAVAAASLVGLVFALDLAVAALLQQWAWLWTKPAVIMLRGALALLLGWLVSVLISRRRRRLTPPADAPSEEA